MWPIRLPDDDGRFDEWSRTALEAVKQAETSFLRVLANMSIGGYELYKAAGAIADPQWPDLTFEQLLEKASKGKVIDSLDHPIIKKLFGAE